MSAYALPGLFPPLPRHQGATERNSSGCDDKADSSTTCTSVVSDERFGISVKEAKIDSALLVHTLARNEPVSTNNQRSRRRTRDESHGEECENSKDEAVQFELSVSFGGNKYSTTRSWPSIIKFRKDLIRNVRSIEIPELPSLHPPGVLCRSFSFLQNLVCSYVPTLEGWLRTVTVLVPPDNPILHHFLHEHDFSITDCELSGNFDSMPSMKQLLDAIEESETEEDDEKGESAFEKSPHDFCNISERMIKSS